MDLACFFLKIVQAADWSLKITNMIVNEEALGLSVMLDELSPLEENIHQDVSERERLFWFHKCRAFAFNKYVPYK